MLTSCIIKNCDSKKRLKSKKVITRTSVYIVYIQCIHLHFPLTLFHFLLCISEKAHKSVFFIIQWYQKTEQNKETTLHFPESVLHFRYQILQKARICAVFDCPETAGDFYIFENGFYNFVKGFFIHFFRKKFFEKVWKTAWQTAKNRL